MTDDRKKSYRLPVTGYRYGVGKKMTDDRKKLRIADLNDKYHRLFTMNNER